MDIINLNLYKAEDIEIGKVSSIAGKAAYKYVEKVIELALDDKIDAL